MRRAARHTPTYPQEGITSNIFTKNIYKKVKTAIRCKRLPPQEKKCSRFTSFIPFNLLHLLRISSG